MKRHILPTLDARGVTSRVERVSGSFFESVPAGGDVYLLKHILHDWNDDECVSILSNVRKAMAPNGRVVVTYMEWAGPPTQQVVMPWTTIDGPASARAFADRLEALPISRARMTSISAALQFSGRLFETSGAKGIRRVIDVSGDGPNNAGGAVVPRRAPRNCRA